MKLVVSFYGMCLLSLDKRQGTRAASASVLLLNGAARPARSSAPGARPLPYHHPLLFVPAGHADVARTGWSPVPTPESLVDTENLVSGRQFAWSLSGLDLTLGRGRGVSMFENQRADGSGRLPDPARAGDRAAYLDWRRIPDLARIAPGARLRSSFTRIGSNVLGIVRFSGGELRGAVPKNAAGNAAPWQFSESYTQVVTDRFEFHCELPGNEITAKGFAGGPPQRLRLKNTTDRVIRLVVVHEATPSDLALLAMTPRGVTSEEDHLPHYTAFYDAIQGKHVDALAPPRKHGFGAGGPFPVIETPNCPPALI